MHTKWTARRLAADAMFAAMVTVLAAAAIRTGNLKITIEAMPVFLGALMLGPVDGMVIGGIGTLLYQLLSYGVTATTALWIAPYVLLGLCVGAVSARHGYDCTKRQLVLLVVFGELGITALNTASLYIDSLIYGYYSPVFVFGTLPLRLGICAAKAVVFSLLLPSLLPLLQIIPLVTTRSKWGRLLIVRKEIPFRAISLLLLFCSNLNANKNFLRMQTSNLEESFETTKPHTRSYQPFFTLSFKW